MLIASTTVSFSFRHSIFPLPFLLCFPLASCLVIAHHSNLCIEAQQCAIMTEWEGLRSRVCNGQKEREGETSWWVCVCIGKTTITFVFLHGSVPLYSQGLVGQEHVRVVTVGWRAAACLCKTLWQLLSAWLGEGPFLSSPITLTSVALSPSSDKGHRPRRWERLSLNIFLRNKRWSPEDFTWEILYWSCRELYLSFVYAKNVFRRTEKEWI